jgi:arylsulfatase A-like enzyme
VRSATCASRGRSRPPLLVLFALVAVLACSPHASGPSIVLVTIDTLRADHVGAYGGPVRLTPHLDAFALGAIVHEAAFTTMPTTGPAHASLFTGLMPSDHGVRANGVPLLPGFAERDLAARLRAAGYRTAAFVTTRLLAPSVTGLRGFEVYDAPTTPLRPGREAVDAALEWLDASSRGPVFLWVHLYDPHAPYGSADQKRRSLPLEPGAYGWVEPSRYADPAARRRAAAEYSVGVGDADEALGLLLAGVRARLTSPPLVIVTADHGEALDEHLDERGYAFDHGEFLDPEQIRIPLLLAGPGVEAGLSPGAVSLRDLYGTLLRAAGVEGEEPTGDERDLRKRREARRVVVIERRELAPGEADPASVHEHAVAASDGSSLVVLGEDGRPSLVREAVAPEVLAAARAALAAVGGSTAAPPVDPATREALRSLGYLRDSPGRSSPSPR